MKRVLFVCIGNSCRSQMAEGFFNQLASPGWRAVSAGTSPAAAVAPGAIAAMREKGIDISRHRPKGLDWEALDHAERVVALCGLDACPASRADAEDWDLEDPVGQPVEKYREVRDIIEGKVKDLMAELD